MNENILANGYIMGTTKDLHIKTGLFDIIIDDEESLGMFCLFDKLEKEDSFTENKYSNIEIYYTLRESSLEKAKRYLESGDNNNELLGYSKHIITEHLSEMTESFKHNIIDEMSRHIEEYMILTIN